MSQVETVPHECEGNLVFADYGLSPYWSLSKLLTAGFNGFSGVLEASIDGESWTLTLSYQKSGIAPRLTDSVGGDRLYEFRISAYGHGERKANFLIQPRFPDMRHYETGEPISTPFDKKGIEGINVRFAGSNLEPDEFLDLLPEFVQALAREGGVYVNPEYFAGPVHEWSNITTYERYVRVARQWSQKLVGRTGVMQRLLLLCATEKDSKVEYRVDNTGIVGYNHRLVRLSTSVPPYWFPFVPVRSTDGDNAASVGDPFTVESDEFRLERTLLLDVDSLGLSLEEIPPSKWEILRPDPDLLPDEAETYRILDEEVPLGG